MTPTDRPGSAIGRIRRLRGVTWAWRPDAPIDRDGREGGVIAQDVQAVMPDLVERGPTGHLRVDYGGLAIELSEAVLELNARMEEVEPIPGDDPVKVAMANLKAGKLRPIDHTALVGTLVEAVKELDRRLAAIEQRPDDADDG